MKLSILKIRKSGKFNLIFFVLKIIITGTFTHDSIFMVSQIMQNLRSKYSDL